MRKRTVGWWLLLGPALPGCVVFGTLEGVDEMIEPQTGSAYYLYVPTTYKAQRAWPLIVVCHGTPPFDTASFQIKQWKSLAESERFIVAAPKLVGTRGLAPPPEEQIARQRRDERTILAVVNHVRGSRHVAGVIRGARQQRAHSEIPYLGVLVEHSHPPSPAASAAVGQAPAADFF